MKLFSCLVFAAALAVVGCTESGRSSPAESRSAPPGPSERSWSESELTAIQSRFGETQVTASGLRYVVVHAGTGSKPTPGSMIRAHYHGTFLDGRVFDSSLQRGDPFSFRLGLGQVIRGWDEAFGDMAVGEKRVLVVPWWLAYGENGRPGRIPPKTALVFEVELLGFEQVGAVPRAASP